MTGKQERIKPLPIPPNGNGTELRRVLRRSLSMPGTNSMVFLLGIVAVLVGLADSARGGQTRIPRPFGPGRCGPVDPSYVRIANATGGQVLPLGPSEVGGAAPLMSASFDAQTVLWATGALAENGPTMKMPIDSLTSRVAFILSTDGSIGDMVVTNPSGISVSAGAPGVQAAVFGCVRAIIVEQPAVGEWTVHSAGKGTFWLVVHARSDLALDEAAFVQVGGRPGHEGLFKISGQPVAGRPASLRAHITREAVTDVGFDLVSMNGESLQPLELSPATTSNAEEEYLGEIARLPMVAFRVRMSGHDSSGALYQRVSRAAFHLATVEVTASGEIVLPRGQRTAVKVRVRNVGPAARFEITAVANATVLSVEPRTVQLQTNESREVTIWVDVPPSEKEVAKDIIVTAESAGDPFASNSAILRTTVQDPRP